MPEARFRGTGGTAKLASIMMNANRVCIHLETGKGRKYYAANREGAGMRDQLTPIGWRMMVFHLDGSALRMSLR